MLDFLQSVDLGRTFAFLASGEPPIYLRLLALNAFFLATAGVRRAVGAEPLSSGMMLLAQLVILGANLFVLFQPETEAVFATFMGRF